MRTGILRQIDDLAVKIGGISNSGIRAGVCRDHTQCRSMFVQFGDVSCGTGAEAGCLSGTGLLRESAAAHEILETRVRSERIEAWSDQDARVEPLFVAFLEPTHRLIRIPERRVDHGDFRSKRLARG